jgi:hypothetical protein
MGAALGSVRLIFSSVEVIFRDQIFQGKGRIGFEIPSLVPHHDTPQELMKRAKGSSVVKLLEVRHR